MANKVEEEVIDKTVCDIFSKTFLFKVFHLYFSSGLYCNFQPEEAR